MVKRKTPPRKGINAGFAARTGLFLYKINIILLFYYKYLLLAEPILDQTKSEIDTNSDETQPDINNNRPASTILKTGSTIQRTDMPTKTTIERQRPTTSTSTPLIKNNQVAKANLLKIGATKATTTANKRGNNQNANQAEDIQSESTINRPTNKQKQKPAENNLLKIATKRNVNVLKDIKRLQDSTKLLIPRAPFLRYVFLNIFFYLKTTRTNL